MSTKEFNLLNTLLRRNVIEGKWTRQSFTVPRSNLPGILGVVESSTGQLRVEREETLLILDCEIPLGHVRYEFGEALVDRVEELESAIGEEDLMRIVVGSDAVKRSITTYLDWEIDQQ